MRKAVVLVLAVTISVLYAAGFEAHAERVPTPLKQARDGVAPSETVCSDGRVLVQSPSGSPACVFAESAKTLEWRGFVLLSEDPHDMQFVEQPDAPEKSGTGSADTDNPGDRPFVTTWRTTSQDESITIPVGNATGAYTVDWGDGSVSANVTGDQGHAYADPGEYAVSISGDFTRIRLGEDRGNANKLVSIYQWGDTRWESMVSAFSGAALQDNAVDAPDLSMVTDMSRMFQWSSFNGNLTGWDVSGVEDMSWMFANSGFNGDVSEWDVSGVEDMSWMFAHSDFNGDVSGWDVSGVEEMVGMFDYADSFNSDISNWDVSGWTFNHKGLRHGPYGIHSSLLTGASSFAQNLGNLYIVLDGNTIDGSTGIVGMLYAQSIHFDIHRPEYGIGSGGDSDYFEIVDRNTLRMKDIADTQKKPSYSVNVTSAGWYGTGNFRVLEVAGMG